MFPLFMCSEPMGTLLVNERMLETYIYARKRFLKPGGKMFPQIGRIHVAAFSDEVLYGELVSKAAFWLQVLQCSALCRSFLGNALASSSRSPAVLQTCIQQHTSLVVETTHTHQEGMSSAATPQQDLTNKF